MNNKPATRRTGSEPVLSNNSISPNGSPRSTLSNSPNNTQIIVDVSPSSGSTSPKFVLKKFKNSFKTKLDLDFTESGSDSFAGSDDSTSNPSDEELDIDEPGENSYWNMSPVETARRDSVVKLDDFWNTVKDYMTDKLKSSQEAQEKVEKVQEYKSFMNQKYNLSNFKHLKSNVIANYKRRRASQSQGSLPSPTIATNSPPIDNKGTTQKTAATDSLRWKKKTEEEINLLLTGTSKNLNSSTSNTRSNNAKIKRSVSKKGNGNNSSCPDLHQILMPLRKPREVDVFLVKSPMISCDPKLVLMLQNYWRNRTPMQIQQSKSSSNIHNNNNTNGHSQAEGPTKTIRELESQSQIVDLPTKLNLYITKNPAELCKLKNRPVVIACIKNTISFRDGHWEKQVDQILDMKIILKSFDPKEVFLVICNEEKTFMEKLSSGGSVVAGTPAVFDEMVIDREKAEWIAQQLGFESFVEWKMNGDNKAVYDKLFKDF